MSWLSQAGLRSGLKVTIGLAVLGVMIDAVAATDAEQLNTLCEGRSLLMDMLQKAPGLINDANQLFPITADYIAELTNIISACDQANVTQTCLSFFASEDNFDRITWSHAILSACSSC